MERVAAAASCALIGGSPPPTAGSVAPKVESPSWTTSPLEWATCWTVPGAASVTRPR